MCAGAQVRTMTDESQDHDQREMGVDFGPLSEELDEHDYPTTTEELVAEYGDHELEYEGGSERFRDVLGPQGDQTFEDAEEVRQSVYNMVGVEAVGRARYSDRGDDSAEDDESI